MVAVDPFSTDFYIPSWPYFHHQQSTTNDTFSLSRHSNKEQEISLRAGLLALFLCFIVSSCPDKGLDGILMP